MVRSAVTGRVEGAIVEPKSGTQLDIGESGKTFSNSEIEIWAVNRSQSGEFRCGGEGDEWEVKGI